MEKGWRFIFYLVQAYCLKIVLVIQIYNSNNAIYITCIQITFSHSVHLFNIELYFFFQGNPLYMATYGMMCVFVAFGISMYYYIAYTHFL